MGCAVLGTTIVAVGGQSPNGDVEKTTFIFNQDTMKWFKGDEEIGQQGMFWSCAAFKSDVIICTGGSKDGSDFTGVVYVGTLNSARDSVSWEKTGERSSRKAASLAWGHSAVYIVGESSTYKIVGGQNDEDGSIEVGELANANRALGLVFTTVTYDPSAADDLGKY